MTKSIYLLSPKINSGKTAASIGLFKALKENEYDPGYFKPIGDPFSDTSITKADKDVTVIHKMLERKYSREEICPIMISPSNFLDEIPLDKVEGVKELIKSTFDDLASKHEIILIEGNHNYNHFYSIGLDDMQIAKTLESDVILISKLEDDSDIDHIIIVSEKISKNEMELKGVIINNVTMLQEAKIQEKYFDLLNNKGIVVLGVIPRSRLLSSPTIGEVLDATAGRLLTEDLELMKDNIIENFVIGAMQTNDAIKYMRKSPNLGIITGGDRLDLILMSIELGVLLIVLTGNLQPGVIALAKAKEMGIPIILVNTDTYTTASNIQNINTKIQQGEIEECKNQIIEHVNWKLLIED